MFCFKVKQQEIDNMTTKVFGSKIWTYDEAKALYDVCVRVMDEDNSYTPNVARVYAITKNMVVLKDRTEGSISRAMNRLSNASCWVRCIGDKRRVSDVYEQAVGVVYVKNVQTPQLEKVKVHELGNKPYKTNHYFPNDYASNTLERRLSLAKQKVIDAFEYELGNVDPIEKQRILNALNG
jgi:hypothetical protein